MEFIKNILREINIRNNFIAKDSSKETKEISIDDVNHFDKPKISHLVCNEIKHPHDDDLANSIHRIRYPDGHIMTIKYPPNCNRSRWEIGDYCWALALAFQEDKVDNFMASGCCPCEI